RLANAPPDADHPYGHGKFEPLGAIILSSILFIAGLGIAIDGISHFDHAEVPSAIALIAAIVGIIAKEGVFQYSIRIGRKIRSNLVIANAWHDRADALSSLASFAGIIGALAGYPILDAVGAVLVSLFILHMAFTIGWRSLQELL